MRIELIGFGHLYGKFPMLSALDLPERMDATSPDATWIEVAYFQTDECDHQILGWRSQPILIMTLLVCAVQESRLKSPRTCPLAEELKSLCNPQRILACASI